MLITLLQKKVAGSAAPFRSLQRGLILLFFLILITGPRVVFGQTTVTIGNGTSANSTNVLFSTSTTSNKYSKSVSVYTAAELTAAGALPGNLTKIAWKKGGTGEYTGSDISLSIYIKPVSYSIHPADPVNWASEIVGATQVFNSSTSTIPVGAGWKEYILTTPFAWNGSDNLEILTDFYRPGTPTASITWEYTTGQLGATAAQVASTPLTTVRHTSNRPNVQLTFAPGNPCTTPPVAGQAVSSAGTACSGVSFSLTLSGITPGAGQTFQWQFSANGTSGWTDIAGAISPSYTTSQTSTQFYRARVTCNSQSAISGPVQVITNATPLSGTITINKNSSASATNFLNITSAVNELACRGVSGPVVLNVVAGSGPYNEQVTITAIPGASAANKITFNGNNNKVTYSPSAADRHILRLDGADHITFNNFQIEATSLTHGWGVHLMGGADFNTLSNNSISIASTNTTESNTVGIVLTNSATSVTVGGNTGNNNIISGNTITGGFKGLHINGTTSTGGNNQVINNTVKEFYSYGIEVAAAHATLVEGNNFSRPARTPTGTFYGVYLSASATATQVSKNRIHNTNGGDPTGTVYGLYITGSDAPAGEENIFSNNLVYNLNTVGTIYGIYNSGSAGAYYYHNTIVIDNTNNTSTGRGFYQTTGATNIKFINNLVSVTAGNSGTKTAIHLNTVTSAITSNNNIFHVSGVAGIGSWGGAGQPTLADWQTSSSQDANSIAGDPQYSNPASGDFTPSNPLINNIGQGVGIATDITGLARNPAMPDAGAYEFLNTANDVGITAITSPNSVCGLTGIEIITAVLTNFGTAVQNNISVSYTINGTAGGSQLISGPLNPGSSITFTFTAPVNMSATGGYTIVATSALAGDTGPANNSTTKVVTNALFGSLPVNLNFETAASGVTAMRNVTKSQSGITEGTGASFGPGSAKGMIMAGGNAANWTIPAGTINSWTTNPEHFAATYICFNPAGGASSDSLWLTFDLRQLYKTANANTNFRITVNGIQQGPTYNPPFTGSGNWTKVKIDLTAFKNNSSVEIGFESSVSETYSNGAGPANLIDNIVVTRRIVSSATDEELQSNLSCYPNPSGGRFNLILPAGKNYTIEIFDMKGKLIIKQEEKTGINSFDLTGNARGVYMVRVNSGKRIAFKKMVID